MYGTYESISNIRHHKALVTKNDAQRTAMDPLGMAGLHLLADGLTKPLLGPSVHLFRSKLRLHPGKNQEPKVRSCNVGTSIGRVGPWLAVLVACTALIAKGQFVTAALGVLGAVLGLWKEGCRPDSKDAQGPKPRPQQECNKNGRESTINENLLGLDRSGTVTPMSITEVVPAPQKEKEKFMSQTPAIRAFRRVHGEDGSGDRAQLPVHPGRAVRESTAAARGYAAARAPIVLDVGRHGYGGSGVAPVEGIEDNVVRVEEGENHGEARIYRIPLLQPPIRNFPRDLCVMTRSVGPNDGANAAAVWDVEMFQTAPTGSDKWITWWNGLLVRSHGTTRRRSFDPLHRSTPHSPEHLLKRRCTILFFGSGHTDRQIRIDNWSETRPWQLDCLVLEPTCISQLNPLRVTVLLRLWKGLEPISVGATHQGGV